MYYMAELEIQCIALSDLHYSSAAEMTAICISSLPL